MSYKQFEQLFKKATAYSKTNILDNHEGYIHATEY